MELNIKHQILGQAQALYCSSSANYTPGYKVPLQMELKSSGT